MEKEKKLKRKRNQKLSQKPSLANDLEHMNRLTRRQILMKGDSIYTPFRRTPRLYVADRFASRSVKGYSGRKKSRR